MKLAALLVSLFLFDVLPAQAGPHGTPTPAASVHQPSHHMQPGLPGGGRTYQSPRVAGVSSARPGHYTSNDRYSGGRAVYAAYTSAGYGGPTAAGEAATAVSAAALVVVITLKCNG